MQAMPKKFLLVLGVLLVLIGGIIGSFGAGIYGFLLGAAITYFILKKYFPDFIGVKKEQTFGQRVLEWIGRIALIFIILFVFALIALQRSLK